MEKAEENIPPKKLKQATLSFFKSAPAKGIKASPPVPSQGLKRKLSSESESPGKAAKLSKPLIQTVSNADQSPNKGTKLSNKKVAKKNEKTVIEIDDSDQEVSSSSEAEAKANARKKGKCLLDKFVCKIPSDSHVISSTNEGLEENNCTANDENDEEKSKSSPTNKKSDSPKPSAQENSSGLPKDINNSKENNSKIEKNVEPKENVSSLEKSKELDGESNLDDSAIKMDTSVNSSFGITPKKASESLMSPVKSLDDTTTPAKNETIGTPSHKSTPSRPEQTGTPLSSSLDTPSTSVKKRKPRKVDEEKKKEMEALKQKQKEEKEKEKEERKRKIEEEKMKKEQAKRELKEAKEKEKQEQKDKLEKEKKEKLLAKEEEKRKKEEIRLQKEEEKKKIQEAKDEEKRKKEEEKKAKEEEKRLKEEEKLKEEEEKKKKAEKTKAAFQSFFIKVKEPDQKQTVSKTSEISTFFIPFEPKKDMSVAPAVRGVLTQEKKAELDNYLQDANQNSGKDYLVQLRKRQIKPIKTGRILRKNPELEKEVEVIHDSDAIKKVFHKAKLLQFHTDYRPPYFGTWRKETSLNARNPWYKDGATFDYEVDSEEEWEDEEPGESLSCSEGEEDKGEEAAEEEEEDGWMVPHGYLSEDEGCNEDDEITPEKLKLQQQAKAKAWEEAQKRKVQAAPVIAVGPYFTLQPSTIMQGDVRMLYDFKAVILASVIPIPTSLSLGTEIGEKTDQAATPKVPKGPEKKTVTEEAMPHLIKLLHGNTAGLKRLVKEFRVFWLKTNDQPDKAKHLENKNEGNDKLGADVSMNESLNDSGEESKISEESTQENAVTKDGKDEAVQEEEDGYGCSISKRQLEKKIMSIAARDKRPGFGKVCWYVNQSILSQYHLADLPLLNSWVFLTKPPKLQGRQNMNKSLNDSTNVAPADVEEPVEKPDKQSDQKSITAFTMSREELQKQEPVKPRRVSLVSVRDDKEIHKKKQNADSAPTTTKECHVDLGINKTKQTDNDVSVTPPPTKKARVSVMDMLIKKSSSKKIDEKSDLKNVNNIPADTDLKIEPKEETVDVPNEKKLNEEVIVLD